MLAVLTLVACPAVAQENSEDGTDPGGDSAVSGLVEISGFVDASYTYSNLDDSNTFGLDQVEIDLSRNLGDIGSLRADLEWVSDGEGGFTLDAEQGYVTLDLGLGRGEGNYPTLTFGKFNAPIGFELLDAPDMYQYSHSLVFNIGLPTNLSGAMLSMDLGGGIDVVVHMTNGWDENVDANTNKMIGGRLGYSHEHLGAIGFSAMRGDNEELVSGQAGASLVSKLTVYDIDLTLTPVPGLIIGGEYNNSKRELDESDQEFNWNFYMVMAHYRLTDVMGLTGRYDYFSNSSTMPSRRGRAKVNSRTHQALTVAPTFALTDGLGFLMELRRDFSDDAIFGDPDEGEQEKSVVNFAFEMTYSF
ncbi:MAG: outer membrane beta-barrel protein [Gemmatimonadota bacterium]|nr:outer membrane beta-barrel protein [Gemmatimonadota bacterium]